MHLSVYRWRVNLIIHSKSMRVVLQYSFPEPICFEFCPEIANTHPVIWFAECDVSLYIRITPDKIFAGLRCIPFGKVTAVKKNLNSESVKTMDLRCNCWIFSSKLINSRIGKDPDIAPFLIMLCSGKECKEKKYRCC